LKKTPNKSPTHQDFQHPTPHPLIFSAQNKAHPLGVRKDQN
jgi:hypothetical protein